MHTACSVRNSGIAENTRLMDVAENTRTDTVQLLLRYPFSRYLAHSSPNIPSVIFNQCTLMHSGNVPPGKLIPTVHPVYRYVQSICPLIAGRGWIRTS